MDCNISTFDRLLTLFDRLNVAETRVRELEEKTSWQENVLFQAREELERMHERFDRATS
jgi:uncharacterized coiled-coil protein SlyX